MSIQVKAIYENGVFRPLQSVELPEKQEVTVTIDGHSADSSDHGDQVLFALPAERWQSFCDALDVRAKGNPAAKIALGSECLRWQRQPRCKVRFHLKRATTYPPSIARPATERLPS